MGPEEKAIYFTFIAGLSILAVFMIAYSISIARHLKRRHQRYRDLALRDSAILERERNRIAEDLHDDFGNTLAVIRLGLEKLREQYPGNEIIEHTSEHLDRSAAKLRAIAYNLMPKTVQTRGLVAGIEMLATQLNNTGKMSIRLNVAVNETPFDKSRILIVYRMVQEMLNNTVKHASANVVQISLQELKGKLRLNFADNGKGFSIDEIHNRETKNGLKNICSRIELLGAACELNTAPGAGTEYIITIPIDSMTNSNGNGTDKPDHSG